VLLWVDQPARTARRGPPCLLRWAEAVAFKSASRARTGPPRRACVQGLRCAGAR
jgi:hypothetical protein